MALSDIVNVTISASTQAPTAPGFGVPMILGYHTKFAELTRSYTSLAGMIADGFAVTDPEYLAAVALQSQNPSPPRWVVGRRTCVPTKIVSLTPALVSEAAIITYNVYVNGTKYSYTTDGTATVKEVCDGLVAAYAGPHGGVTMANVADTHITLTATAGTWFTWKVTDNSGNANGMGKWTVDDISTTSTPQTDLAACLAADSSWYAFVLTFQNKVDGALAATWAASNKRLFLIDLADNDVKGSGSSDLASTVKTAANGYTAVCYHQLMEEFMSAAWLGNCLPLVSGTETWKFKTLGGVTADILTDAEVGYINGKYGNWYQSLGGVNITQNGTTGKPQFIDVVRFIDWLKANLQYDVYTILVNNPKVPYSDAGVALIEGAIRGRLQIGEKVGGLLAGQSTVSVPLVANETTADRGNRTIPDIYFTAKLAGAIHSLTISGVVSF